MTGCVARRRYDPHPGSDLLFAIDETQVGTLELDAIGDIPVQVAAGLVFTSLNESRNPGKERVSAAVVVVEMAVDDRRDVINLPSDCSQRIAQFSARGREKLIEPRMLCSHPSVEQ